MEVGLLAFACRHDRCRCNTHRVLSVAASVNPSGLEVAAAICAWVAGSVLDHPSRSVQRTAARSDIVLLCVGAHTASLPVVVVGNRGCPCGCWPAPGAGPENGRSAGREDRDRGGRGGRCGGRGMGRRCRRAGCVTRRPTCSGNPLTRIVSTAASRLWPGLAQAAGTFG
jgi:hypothetical protein